MQIGVSAWNAAAKMMRFPKERKMAGYKNNSSSNAHSRQR
jgi:hypothetical protein